MLQPFHIFPDQADIYTLVCSRELDLSEEAIFTRIVEIWLKTWRDHKSESHASAVIPLVTRSVYGFAVDDSHKQYQGFIGSDIDPLFDSIRLFEQHATDPIIILPGEAFKINNVFVPFTLIDKSFIKNGGLTEQTLMIRPCTMAEWRMGKFIHPLRDDPVWLAAISQYMNN